MRRPVVVAAATLALLLVLASPMTGMKLGVDLGVAGLGDVPAAKGQRLLTEEFSPGAVMPISVVYTAGGDELSADDLAAVRKLDRRIERDDRVSSVTSVMSGGAGSPTSVRALRQSPLVGEDGRRTYLSVVPAVPPDEVEATELVRRIRGELVPRAIADVPGSTVLVGGQSAQMVDIEQETNDKLWLVVGLVLGLSFLFLLVMFRSVLLPLKAIVMNLFAYGAAFGALLWVFQQGNLEGLFGFESRGMVQVYLPLVMFAMLFGLSMDYEVFLVRRIQEVWRDSGDNEHAVAVGLERTALQITAAAAIMVVVFGAFITGGVMEMKQIGFGFAFAILIDATIVRLLLVPAFMRLAGRYNWWLPTWLDRVLPPVARE